MSALAAGEPTMDIGQVRASMTTFLTKIDPLVEMLEDCPFKTGWVDAKTHLNTALASLGAGDHIPASTQAVAMLRDIIGMFTKAQELMGGLADAAKEAATKSNTALAGLPKQISDGVTSAITSQVAAGTLFTKADHEAAVTAAATKAKADAEGTFTVNLTKATSRMSVLASAGLGTPDTATLLGEDTVFTAWQTKQTARKTELDPFKLGPDRMKALMSASDADYAFNLALVKELKTPAAAPAARINPLEGGGKAPVNPVGRTGYFC